MAPQDLTQWSYLTLQMRTLTLRADTLLAQAGVWTQGCVLEHTSLSPAPQEGQGRSFVHSEGSKLEVGE